MGVPRGGRARCLSLRSHAAPAGAGPARGRDLGWRGRRSVLLAAATLAALTVAIAPVSAAAADGSKPVTSFDGLNHFTDHTLNGVSIEPPSPALCVGDGYVVESVASAIVVYDTHGNVVQQPMSLNEFYDYAAVPLVGPRLNDPSCYFDAATQRWFVAVLTLEVFSPAPHVIVPTGVNHVDIAVSQTADPTAGWAVYEIPARHDCPGQSVPSLCLGDFPRIGADAHGFYVTTNDYNFYTHAFRSASVYAFSKQQLETNTANAAVTRFDTAGMVNGSQAGFTLSPAQSSHPGDPGGPQSNTEYFLSSNAADEVNATGSRKSDDLIVWALSNTESLDSDHPSLELTTTVLSVDEYAFPPPARQKDGPVPLAECLNDKTAPIPCWVMLHVPPPVQTATEGQAIDTGDTRMQQVVYAQGVVYGALGTAVAVDGTKEAGLEWFAVRVGVADRSAVHPQLLNQGYVAQEGASLISPALAVNPAGHGAIAFSLMGPNDYPSAAYVPFDVRRGTGDIQIAAAGIGPDDGITNYGAALGMPGRERWGDYGAAVADGSRIWMASEYISQSCEFAEWIATGATCGNTRAGLANWDTRITEISAGG